MIINSNFYITYKKKYIYKINQDQKKIKKKLKKNKIDFLRLH